MPASKYLTVGRSGIELIAAVSAGALSFLAYSEVVGQSAPDLVGFHTTQVIEQTVVDLDFQEFDYGRNQSFALAHVDNGSSIDLVAINNDDGIVHVYQGRGDGTFEDPRVIELKEPYFPIAVVVEDFTGPFSQNGGAPDGNADLFVIDEDGSVDLWIGDGMGDFAEPDQVIDSAVDVASFIKGAVAADFDNDGDVDLAVGDEHQVIFLCNNDGAIESCPQSIATLPIDDAVDLATGDFDGDGNADVITIDPFSRVGIVIYGDGTGRFTVDEVGISLSGLGYYDEARIGVANFDNSGPDDIVVIDNEEFSDFNGQTYVGSPDRELLPVSFSSPARASAISVADFDGDGIADLVLSDQLGLTMLSGNTIGDFAGGSLSTRVSRPGPVAGRLMQGAEVLKAADLNGDGRLDLVGLVAYGFELEIALSGGDELLPPCIGDCNDDHRVSVDELIIGINISLGRRSVHDCRKIDANEGGEVSINELIRAVNASLLGCFAQ